MNIPNAIDVKDGLYDLQNKYFTMFSTLYKMRCIVSPDLFNLFSKHLKESYEREYDYLSDGVLLERAQAVWERKEKISHFVPRRRFFFLKNRVAKAIEKNVLAEFETFVSWLEAGCPPDVDIPEQECEMSEEESTALVTTIMSNK